jgi:exopolysaccharide production protein ExoQ
MYKYSNNSVSLLKFLIRFLSVSMFIMASGAFIYLIKEGGAQDQSFHITNRSASFIDKLPLLWLAASMLSIGLYVVITKFKIIYLPGSIALLLTVCVISAFWSDESRSIISTSLTLIMSFLLIGIEVKFYGANSTLHSLRLICIFILITSYIAIFLVPSYGIGVGAHEGSWQGVFVHKNEMGNFFALTLVLFLTRAVKLKLIDFIYCGFALLLVYGSESASGALNAAVIVLVSALIRYNSVKTFVYKNRYLLVILFIAVNFLIVYIALNVSQFEIGKKDSSFSNRNMIWLYILSKAGESPWFGFGLGQLSAEINENSGAFFNHVGFVVGTAHNGFIQTFYELGLVGVGVMVLILLMQVNLAADNRYFNLSFVMALGFIMVNAFQSAMVSFNVDLLFLMYSAFICKETAHKIRDWSDKPLMLQFWQRRTSRFT